MKSYLWTYGIPAIPTLLLFSVILLAIPLEFNKYLLKKIHSEKPGSWDQISFADLNGDGIDEMLNSGGIDSFTKEQGHYFQAYKVNNVFNYQVIAQVNQNEIFLSGNQFFLADFNKNDKEEIYIPNLVGNCLEIRAYEYPNLNEPIKSIFLDTIIRYKNLPALKVIFAFQADITHDGIDEVFFNITNSYPVYPRKFYRWDLVENQVISSPNNGFIMMPASLESKAGHIIRFTGSSYAPSNWKPNIEIPFPDTCSYLWLLNQNLQFEFTPIPVANFPGSSTSFISKKDFISSISYPFNNQFNTVLEKRDPKTGQLKANRFLANTQSKLLFHNDNFILFQENSIQILNEDLSTRKTINLEFGNYRSSPVILDLNKDGFDEFIYFHTPSGQVIILSHDLKYTQKFFLPNSNTAVFQLFHKQEETYLTCFTDNQLTYFKYENNPYYIFKIPYYLLLAIISYTISWFSFRRYNNSIESRHQQELELNRLQMLAIKNQVDPHFTLNSLASIDAMVNNSQKEQANSFILKLSRMVHQTLMNSDKIACSLYEELGFIRNYCQLQQIRMSVPLQFSIEVDEALDPVDITIPKQLLFTYVENAVKHGIKPKPEGGKLDIVVGTENRNILITIADTGIGIKQSQAQKTTGTGKGLEIIEQILELYEKRTKEKIDVIIDSSINGTTVEIRLPIHPSTSSG